MRQQANASHRLLRIAAAHELDVGEHLRQTDELVLGELVLVLQHERAAQLPVFVRLVVGFVVVDVPLGVVRHVAGGGRMLRRKGGFINYELRFVYDSLFMRIRQCGVSCRRRGDDFDDG